MMALKRSKKSRAIKYGDPRVFFESKTTKPFVGPAGIKHDVGAVVRGSAFIEISTRSVSVSLPSMAELIFHQAARDLGKAVSLKDRALAMEFVNDNYHIVDEEAFYIYMQLCCSGVLGLYSALEAMVFELYIRKYKEKEIKVDGKTLAQKEYTDLGFVRKLTTVASQLSGKVNIHNTELLPKAKEIQRLRTIIQHWNIERRDDYFINLPRNHPLKVFVKIDPNELVLNTRSLLDHYSLKS